MDRDLSVRARRIFGAFLLADLIVTSREEPATASKLEASEFWRQLIHIGAGFWAFLLPWSGSWPLVGLAVAAIPFNAWLLPRLGDRWLWRRGERAEVWASGMVLYPMTVTLLLVVFHRRLEVAAAGWGLLAFGDGLATLVGGSRNGRRLPWNGAKTWSGLLAYLVAGWLAVWVLVAWVAPGEYPPLFLGWVAAGTAAFGALLESTPQRLDDNLTAPLLAALLLLCLLESAGGWQEVLRPSTLGRLLLGVLINVAFAAATVAAGALDRRGAAVGAVLGTVVFTFLSWRGFLVLAIFVGAGSLASRWGWAAKNRLRVAEANRGRRRAANALANGGVAALCAAFAGITPHRELFELAFVCSLAAATADTMESEFGTLWGRPTVLITSWRRVPAGTDGGISVVGTLAGVGGALLVTSTAWWLGLVSPADRVLELAGLAVLATVVESVAGATLERRGLLDNHGINLLNTLSAALGGAALALVVA